MREEILRQLDALEREKDIRILLAIESGSRAWGFASPDSDYDVRIIYAQAPANYLSIRERKDTIELPISGDLDIGGWDIRKALQLFYKSNAPLYEWLQSPIIYKVHSDFSARLQELMPAYFSHRAGCHHYLSMTKNTFENDLKADQVKLKKYFYALRPALAAGWIIEKQTVPPMEFGTLRKLVSLDWWQKAVDELLEAKSRTDEKGLIPSVPSLNEWISETLERYNPIANEIEKETNPIEPLDELFRKYIYL